MINNLEVVSLTPTRLVHADRQSKLDVTSSIPTAGTILVIWSKSKNQNKTTYTNDRHQVTVSWCKSLCWPIFSIGHHWSRPRSTYCTEGNSSVILEIIIAWDNCAEIGCHEKEYFLTIVFLTFYFMRMKEISNIFVQFFLVLECWTCPH